MYHPGPQKRKFSFNHLSFFLYLFAIIFAILSLFALIQTNATYFDLDDISILKIKILDTSPAITIFVTFIGLIITRNNLSYGLRPYIVYECQMNIESKLNIPNYSKYLTVQIKNVGVGVSMIKSFKYKIVNKGDDKSIKHDYQDYSSALSYFQKLNLINRKDFFLKEITKGFALSSKDEIFIFEIPILKLDDLKQVDIQIIFQSFFGTKYTKEIYCIPRKGISYNP